MTPRLSIITVCLNNYDGLEKTIESVMDQTFTSFEFLIVDGGSDDGSTGLIKEHEEHISWWVSEPDKGIYNAMNKGIKRAKGEYCLFLNSGDCLASKDVLKKVFSEPCDADIIYGNLVRKKGEKSYRITRYPAKLNFHHFIARVASIHHQASFIRRKLFDQYGLYREDLRIIADWEFFLRAVIVVKCTTQYINKSICIFDPLGISSGKRNSEEKLKYRTLHEYFPDRSPEEYQRLAKQNRGRLVALKSSLSKSKILYNILRHLYLPINRLREYIVYKYVKR